VASAREGVALRTLVYHEVLTAYLAYVKARGYTSMFIWACPPLQVRFYPPPPPFSGPPCIEPSPCLAKYRC
jgi:hypothetical protein